MDRRVGEFTRTSRCIASHACGRPQSIEKRTNRGLERHALLFDLRDPRCGPVFGLVALVVLVEWASEELSSLIALRLAVRICARVDVTDQFGSGRREGRVQLLNAIAEILAVGPGITAAKDSNWFATKVNVLDFVDKVIPRSARSVFIGSGVPGWATDNEAPC